MVSNDDLSLPVSDVVIHLKVDPIETNPIRMCKIF